MPKRTEAVALRVLVLLVCTFGLGPSLVGFTPTAPADVRMPRLDSVASALATTLQISKRVEVVAVQRNDLVVSVEPLVGAEGGYRVIFDQSFFDRLNDEEIAAALAHEIGHIWISTHFPYRQTESRANEIALKVTPRKAMESLYAKLWAYTGLRGDIEQLLGSETEED